MKINVKNNDKTVVFPVKYHYNITKELKNASSSEYDMENDSWTLEDKHVKAFINNVGDVGSLLASMSSLLDSIHQHEEYHTGVLDDTIKTAKITVEKVNKAFVVIGFDFDNAILDIVRGIEKEHRKWDSKIKRWSVRKELIPYLTKELKDLNYVEVSELEALINKNEEQTVELKDFPNAKYTPLDYQIETAKKKLKHKKIIDSLEAGLGKTFTTIMATESIEKKCLIVCPASVKENWKKEIHQVNKDAKVEVLEGKSHYPQQADYIVMNYDILDRFVDQIEADDIDILVLDEAHKIRSINTRGNPTSKRAKICLSLAEKMEYVFPLTATPFVNYTKDIFNLLKVTDHSLALQWYAFANTYCGADSSDYGTSYNGSSNQDKLNNRIFKEEGIIRLRSEDHLDLPERVRSFIPLKISLTKYNKKIEDYMKNRKRINDKGEHLVFFNAARKLLAQEKAKHAIKMIQDSLDQNKSVVVFTNYTDVVLKLHEKFKDDSLIIYGETTSKQREERKESFQNKEKRVLIGNIDAAGEGLTLTAAQHMIVIDMHWSPVFMRDQMEKRIHRISQTQPVKIDYLYAIGAKMDELMAESAEKKLNDSSTILDGEKEIFIDKLIKEL
ncbi:DEAD/DEAH box helicase [Halobacillus litoralis]|uniref:DEAD/DEAH box helicase n=1 Tax=Halobacillus litoralis TaxID=45668 RepID=UPI001CD42F5E|nr:helicase-related protein [Halobacillus litoralis]MCA1021594.1 DEAD/DEAH box helicase family protein [Halobacillus litoralis]